MGLYKRGKKWWLDEIVQGFRVHRSLRTSDRRLAEGEAAAIRKAIEERARRRRLGLPDDDDHAATAARSVAELVEEFAKELERRGRSVKHVRNARHRLRAMTAETKRLVEVTPQAVRAALGRIAATPYRAPGEGGEGHLPTPKTLNEYRAALNAFFGWLVKEGRWAKNPVASVSPLRQTGPEVLRAALDAEGLARLLEGAPAARALVYRTAAVTGLRRSELAQLLWSDVDLEGCSLLVRAKIAKNKRGSVLPLPPALRDALKAHRGDALGEANVFASIPKLATFYADLHAAGLTEAPDGRTEEGKIDFHALRVSFATGLARTGSPLALAQRLMRHSTPSLTSSVYTRLGLVDAREAVQKLDAAMVAASTPSPDVGTTVGSESLNPAETCGSAVKEGASLGGLNRKRRRPGHRISAGVPVVGAASDSIESSMEAAGIERTDPASGALIKGGPQPVETGCGEFRDATLSGGTRSFSTSEELARGLLAAAATAPDPAPLLEAARVLLEQARAERGILSLDEARKQAGGAG